MYHNYTLAARLERSLPLDTVLIAQPLRTATAVNLFRQFPCRLVLCAVVADTEFGRYLLIGATKSGTNRIWIQGGDKMPYEATKSALAGQVKRSTISQAMASERLSS